MSEKNDGGPAFPVHEQWTEWSELKAEYSPKTGPRGGMSLRDYFAAKAMVMLADPRTLSALRDEAKEHGKSESALMAVALYEVADAMLAERVK